MAEPAFRDRLLEDALQIVSGSDHNNCVLPGDPPVSVTFAEPAAFRVMDEANLNEFWVDGVRSKGWLWLVTQGGWLHQEEQRSGFLREMTRGDEYLVVGLNDCVSVIAPSPPNVAVAPFESQR